MDLNKHKNHDHYWICDGILYESYNTIRGLRFLEVLDVPGMSDNDKCTEQDLEIIQSIFT